MTLGAEDLEEDPQVHVCAVSVPANGMSTVEHLPSMRLYEDDHGKPMDLKDCTTQAKNKAASKFAQPREALGYQYTFGAMVPAVLEAGIQSVQHTWSGVRREDAAARTFVFAHSPGQWGQWARRGVRGRRRSW